MVNCKCWSRITYSSPDPLDASRFFYKIKMFGFQADFFSKDNRVEAIGPCLKEGLIETLPIFPGVSMVIEGKCWGKQLLVDRPRVLSMSNGVFLFAIPYKRGFKFFVVDSDKISPKNARLNTIGDSIEATRSLLLLMGEKIVYGIMLVEEFIGKMKKGVEIREGKV